MASDGTRRSPARNLVQLVYVSSAARTLAAADLEDIAAVSRRHNDARGLTGFLLHQGSFFYGMLEGPRRLVFDRMEAIITDPRHRCVRILREETIAAHRFHNWSFGLLPPGSAGGPESGTRPDPFIVHLSQRLK